MLRSRFAAVDFDALGGDDFDPEQLDARFAGRLRLEVFSDRVVTAVQDRVDLNPMGGYTWIGHVEERADSSVVLVVHDGVLSGGIRFDGSTFQITPVAGAAHAITELTGDQLPPALAPIPFRGAPVFATTTERDDNLDVLIVYTPKAEADLGGGPAARAFMQQAVAATNERLRNAGFPAELNLIHSTLVPYVESNDLFSDLRRTQAGNDGSLDEIQYVLRDAYQADLVHLVVSNDTPTSCGLAFSMADASSQFADWAYSVSESRCLAVTDIFDQLTLATLGAHTDEDALRRAIGTVAAFRVPLAPAEGALDAPSAGLDAGGRLHWERDSRASWYNVSAESASGRVNEWHNAAQICAGETCDVALADTGGTDRLTVRGWNARGNGRWSAPVTRRATVRDNGIRRHAMVTDPEAAPLELADPQSDFNLSGASFASVGGADFRTSVLTDLGVYVPPNYTSMQPPPPGGTYTDPVFGTTIRRLTDATGLSLGGYVPVYSQHSHYNLDDTYLVLAYGSGGTLVLFDGNGTLIRPLNEAGVLDEARWSRLNPNWLYYHTSNQIRRLDVVTGQVVNIGSAFSGSITFGNGQGDVSDNERIVVIRSNRYVSIYDLANQVQHGEFDAGSWSFDNAEVAKDGNSFIVNYNLNGSSRGRGSEQFDLNGNFMVQLLNAQGHASMGRDINGAAVLYMTNAGTNPLQPAGCDNGIVKISLNGNATRTCLADIPWGIAKHMSAHGNDGWVYVSTYQPGVQPVPASANDWNATDDNNWHIFTDEVFRVRADGSVVERLAHHRSSHDSYWQQPHATISMSGKKLLFGSDFQLNEQNEYADTYLIDVNGGGATGPAVPAMPGNLTGSSAAIGRVDLSWTDNADNETSFRLQRRPPGGTWKTAAWVGANATSYSDTGLDAGDWCYRINAWNTAEASSAHALSTPGCVTVSGDTGGPAVPDAPSNLVAAAVATGRVDLTWTDNADNESSFRIQRRVPAGAWQTAGWIGANATSFSDTGLIAGSWCYRVNAWNTALASSGYATSTPSCVAVDGNDQPPAPTNFQASSTTSTVNLTWQAGPPTTSFRLQWSASGSNTWHTIWIPGNDRSYTHTPPSTGRYCYRIQAFNGASQYSDVVTASPNCVNVPSWCWWCTGANVPNMSSGGKVARGPADRLSPDSFVSAAIAVDHDAAVRLRPLLEGILPLNGDRRTASRTV